MLSYLLPLIFSSVKAGPVAGWGPPSANGWGPPPGYSGGSPPCYGPSCGHGGGDSYCNTRAPADPGPGYEHHETSKAGGYLWPYQVFKSSPLNPPEWEINTTDSASLAPGLIFMTLEGTLPGLNVTKYPAPYIFTDKGQLVWSGPYSNATNCKWQNYNGKPALTFWSGSTTSGTNVGHGYGNVTFLDETYNPITVVCPNYATFVYAGDGPYKCDADIHESFITDRNTLLSSAYNATPTDLTSVGGPADGWIWDAQFYELEPSTGEVLFRWSSFDHVSIEDSNLPITTTGNSTDPYDFFHINSVVNIGDYYLVNGRHTWTTYLLDKQGEIIWRFDGDDGGDFGPLPSNGHFRWEHYVRSHNVTNDTLEISMFNNDNYEPNENVTLPTTLLLYRLPWSPKNGTNESQAELVSLFETPEAEYSDSQGLYDPHLSNENHFACYGQLPLLKEFNPNGEVIWSARAAQDNLAQIYRAYKEPGWHATPFDTPSLVVEKGNSTTYDGYVSWNGATDVTGWNVYVGQEKDDLKMIGTPGFRGFETQFSVPCWAKYVQVGAVEGDKEVRKSNVVTVL